MEHDEAACLVADQHLFDGGVAPPPGAHRERLDLGGVDGNRGQRPHLTSACHDGDLGSGDARSDFHLRSLPRCPTAVPSDGVPPPPSFSVRKASLSDAFRA